MVLYGREPGTGLCTGSRYALILGIRRCRRVYRYLLGFNCFSSFRVVIDLDLLARLVSAVDLVALSAADLERLDLQPLAAFLRYVHQ